MQICFRYELVTNGPKFFTSNRVGLTKNRGFFSFVVFSWRSALRFSKSDHYTQNETPPRSFISPRFSSEITPSSRRYKLRLSFDASSRSVIVLRIVIIDNQDSFRFFCVTARDKSSFLPRNTRLSISQSSSSSPPSSSSTDFSFFASYPSLLHPLLTF